MTVRRSDTSGVYVFMCDVIGCDKTFEIKGTGPLNSYDVAYTNAIQRGWQAWRSKRPGRAIFTDVLRTRRLARPHDDR
jgi:hypothetical protein